MASEINQLKNSLIDLFNDYQSTGPTRLVKNEIERLRVQYSNVQDLINNTEITANEATVFQQSHRIINVLRSKFQQGPLKVPSLKQLEKESKRIKTLVHLKEVNIQLREDYYNLHLDISRWNIHRDLLEFCTQQKLEEVFNLAKSIDIQSPEIEDLVSLHRKEYFYPLGAGFGASALAYFVNYFCCCSCPYLPFFTAGAASMAYLQSEEEPIFAIPSEISPISSLDLIGQDPQIPEIKKDQ